MIVLRKSIFAAEGIGQTPLFQDLQEQIHHIGVGFFNFVKQDDGIGALAHLFGELPALFMADISWRRSCHPADGKFLHVFGHVDLDQGIFAAKHIDGQQPCQAGSFRPL